MSKGNKVVNANENRMARSVYKIRLDNGQTVEHLVPYIPAAKKLISSFAGFEYKNIPEHPFYVIAEFQLCTMLADSKRYSKEKLIDNLAFVLNCSPLILHNAPDLPF